jgi:NADPH:quinone reductase-like Zn-dependent oxidoreductase
MKAVQIKSFGENDVIEVVNDASVPTLKAGQVLINVDAASINPFDLKLRSGMMPLPLPLTLGGDFVGDVAVVGEGVTDLR